MLKIEVIYSPKDNPFFHKQLEVEPGTSVLEAILKSGLQADFPETEGLAVGIFSKPVTLGHIVRAGDRIELYRPLEIDPKEKRRQRALKK